MAKGTYSITGAQQTWRGAKGGGLRLRAVGIGDVVGISYAVMAMVLLGASTRLRRGSSSFLGLRQAR